MSRIRAKSFEIGRIYTNNIWVISKIDENYVGVLRVSEGSQSQPGDKKPILSLNDIYEEYALSQLSTKETELYNSFFNTKTSTQTECTCDINSLMSTGCVCGWFKIEKQQA